MYILSRSWQYVTYLEYTGLSSSSPIGMGTDATRVSSYNPWICLYWLTTGKTVGGTKLYDESNILSREKAIELYTRGSAWFSDEIDIKGLFIENQLADFAVLSKNYFQVPDEGIKEIYSVMTVLGGEIVHASDEFRDKNSELPPVSPDWSPIKFYGAYGNNKFIVQNNHFVQNHIHLHAGKHSHQNGWEECFCWAF